MLHLLAIIALLIFIGERIVHYWFAWRVRRYERRALARMYESLYPPPPATPPQSPLAPRHEPEQRRTDRWFLNAFAIVFTVAVVALVIMAAAG